MIQMITDGLWTSPGLLGLVAGCCCLLAAWILRRPRNLPPGPRGWPLLGNISFKQAQAEPFIVTDLRKKYGDVITYYRGPIRVIMLNSYDAICEAFVKNAEDFSTRPKPFSIPAALKAVKAEGVTFANGPNWREQRRFMMTGLRDFGCGKRSLEGKILEEAKALGNEILRNRNEDFSITKIMRMSTSNVICSIVFGSRYEYDDPKFLELMEATSVFFSVPPIKRLQIFRYIPGLNRDFPKFQNATLKITSHIEEEIQGHQATFDPNDIRDFIDAFLLEKKRRETDENTTFTEQQNVKVVFELFSAGTEITSTTLRWALLYMILHPDIQDRVQQEIDSVIGPDLDPSMDHRTQMPYTEATLTEVGRLASVSAYTVPHATSTDTTFRGYNIPKGTVVHGNLWAVHHDPQLWPEPFKFDPTRFLDDNGKFVKKEEVIPYSIGRRVCPGEQLARMELFLFFTSLLQRFSFKLPEDAPVPSEGEGSFGLMHSPAPYKLVAVTRTFT